MAAKHLLEMVVSSDRGAAHRDQGVAVLGGIQQGGGEHAAVIVEGAQGGRDAADVGEQGLQGGTDGVEHLVVGQRPAGRDDLGAGQHGRDSG